MINCVKYNVTTKLSNVCIYIYVVFQYLTLSRIRYRKLIQPNLDSLLQIVLGCSWRFNNVSCLCAESVFYGNRYSSV